MFQSPECLVTAPQRDQIAMQCADLGMSTALGMIQLRSLECAPVVRRCEFLPHQGQSQVTELTQKPAAALSNQGRDFGLMVREIKEGRRRGKFLALKQHRCAGEEQQQSGRSPEDPWAGQLMRAFPAGRIGDLVVILDEVDETRWRQTERRRGAPLVLPFVPLALIEEAILRGRDKLLGAAGVIGVISPCLAGYSHHRCVMEIVVPGSVDSIAALLLWPDQFRVLWFILRPHNDAAPYCGLACFAGDGSQNVI